LNTLYETNIPIAEKDNKAKGDTQHSFNTLEDQDTGAPNSLNQDIHAVIGCLLNTKYNTSSNPVASNIN